MTRTYVFGNPSGWTLYGGDASEHDYYRSFYVIARHGSRLMVNRREDGSVVYTYVHYDLIEGSDRMGAAHFGMSIVLENGQYTDDFNTVYRFLDALFHKSLERADSLLKKSDDGKLRYNVTKLDDCRECIEWIKSMMPKIFDKTGLKSINSDSSFAEGQAGRIVMFETESNDAEILDAFRQCNWVAISSDYHKPSTQNPDTDSIKEEINLFDIQHQHSTITKTLLDISTGVTDYDIKIIEKIDRRINETRLTLINYINTNPEESDSVKSLQKQYSDLLVSLDAVKSKINRTPSITTSDHKTVHVDNHDNDTSENLSTGDNKDKKADNPLITDEIRNLIHKNFSKICAVLTIIAIIVGISLCLVFFRNSPSIDLGDNNSQQEEPTEEVQDSTTSIEDVKNLLAEKKFEETYNLIAETNSPDSLLMMDVLKDSIEDHLWTLVDVQDGNIEIASFFADNKNLMEKTGFTSEKRNGAIEWSSRAQLHSKLTTILASNNLTKNQLNEGLAIIKTLGDRYANLAQTLNSQYEVQQKAAAQQSKSLTTDKNTKIPSQGNAWVEVNGKQKTFDSNSARGFDSKINNKINLKASGEISYNENPNIIVESHNSSRTNWIISFKAKGRYMFTLTHKKPDKTNTEYQITITVN